METTVDQVEIWKNPTKSLVVTKRQDKLGQFSDVSTRGGETLKISPEDRRMNQEQVRNEKHDPFQNGMLTPVQLLDGDDVEEAAGNPNMLTEEDVVAVLKMPAKDFAARIEAMDSEAVLRRVKQVAQEEDVAPSRQTLIAQRLQQVAPKKKIESGLLGSDSTPTRKQG